MSSIQPLHGLLVVAAIVAFSGPAAVAQNLDHKPAPKLFADTCAACHKSARGLAKGRFRLTLYMFLQDHYASNSTSAWALTNYLDSLDAGKRTPTRAATKPATTARTSLRPPAPVPAR
jgi:mono/diheme cytochrome c family protein